MHDCLEKAVILNQQDKMIIKQIVHLLTILTFFKPSSQVQCPYQPTSACVCDITSDGRKQINCRDRQLTVIPTFSQTPDTYDEITFGSSSSTGCSRCNKISIILDNAFANLQVKKIILTQNAITSFSSNAFAGLEAVLEGLELEGDGTNLPPYGVITSLTNLQLIHFEHFSQTSMGSSNTLGAFPQLKELKFINIKNLNNIAADTFLDTSNQPKFPALNTLVLRDITTLTTLPAGAIQELTNLTDLEISGTGITQIYGLSFQQLTQLVNLHITHNTNLDTIASNAFDGLYNTLEFLFLGNNKLSNLNFLKSGTWNQLTQLNLQHNPLGALPSSVFTKTGQRLQYLNLDQCELTSISAPIFSGLASLHTLILSNNMINTVESAAFQNNPALTELRLDKQKTSMTLNENSFQGIETSLEHLYIGKNTIDIPRFWKLTENLTNLFELNAPEIQLGSIPDKAFKNNENLATLDLGTNNIDSVQDSSFYRLRDSLQSLSLSFNKITTINKCVFSNFTKMEQLHLDGNLLVCDCRIRWLHDWVVTRADKFQAGFLVGACNSPVNLNGQFLHEINSNDLTCDTNYVEPECADLYATTTTTTTSTDPPTTSTEPPLIIPTITVHFGLVTQDSINVIWAVTDKTDVTGYDLEIRKDNAPYRYKPKLHRDAESDEVRALESDTTYTFCVSFYLKDKLYSDHRACNFRKTLAAVATSTTVAITPEPESNIGIIVGACVGGIAFIAIVILIVVILLRYKKPPKKMPPAAPVSFTAAPGGTLPQAGGTARRFAKPKDGKDGAAGVDDIQITTISNGDVDGKDRFSAGSYQFLHEKDFHRGPVPSTSKGHYENDLSTERPLPRTPYGMPSSKGTKSTGYVNTGFTGSANPLPETSANTYSELDPSKIDKKMEYV